jgi:hypothetical protein
MKCSFALFGLTVITARVVVGVLNEETKLLCSYSVGTYMELFDAGGGMHYKKNWCRF